MAAIKSQEGNLVACFTSVLIELEDSEYNRKARERLGLPAKGGLSQEDANRVKKESGIIKTQMILRRLNPTAIVRRNGDQLTVQASV